MIFNGVTTWQKNELAKKFSATCMHVRENLNEILIPVLKDDDESVISSLDYMPISSMVEWWNMDDNARNYIMRLKQLEKSYPGYRKREIEATLGVISDNPLLLDDMHIVMDTAMHEPIDNMILYCPHNADYSDVLTQTDGYMALNKKLLSGGDVFANPWITLNPKAKTLDSAFYIDLAVMTVDQTPLKPKILKLGS